MEKQKYRDTTGAMHEPDDPKTVVTVNTAGLLIEKMGDRRLPCVLLVIGERGLCLPGGEVSGGVPLKQILLDSAFKQIGHQVEFKDFRREPVQARIFESFLCSKPRSPIKPTFFHIITLVSAVEPTSPIPESDAAHPWAWYYWDALDFYDLNLYFRTALLELRRERIEAGS